MQLKDKSKLNRAIGYIIRIFIGLVFVISSIAKLFSLQHFIEIVMTMNMLPQFLVPYFSISLPLIEYFLGMFMVFGIYVRETAKAIMLLLIIFTIVIVFNLIKGNQIECGCFGTLIGEEIGWTLLTRDLIILILTIPIAFPELYHSIAKK